MVIDIDGGGGRSRVPRDLLLIGAVLALALPGQQLRAQDSADERVIPTNQTVITGYGTVGYLYRTEGDNQNEFAAAINPIFLFQFMDRFLFEAEFEFALAEGVTETGLEYAQLDFIATNNLILVGGKFLLPFGVFGPRLHPTWINKFATSPPIYGHHVSEFGAEPLLPVLSDVGVMARGMLPLGSVGIALNLFASNGPSFEGDVIEEGEIPEIEFPGSTGDINTDKMFGGRLDLALLPWTELNLSYFGGNYDEENVLDFSAWNVAAAARYAGFELRGEYIQTRQEIEIVTGFPTFKRQGFYAQLAYRWMRWEPVFRWTQIFGDKLDGQDLGGGAWQAGFGLDYWFAPSIALMAGYELNREDDIELENDRFIVHVAFGF